MGQKQALDWSDFPSLIRSIAEREHEGVVVRIAEEIHVSTALLNQWVHGLVKSPNTKNLYKLSQRYDIPFMDVVATVARTGDSRGKAPRRQGRRTAGSLLLACAVGIGSLLGWPSDGALAGPRTLYAAQLAENTGALSLIRHAIRRLFARWAYRLPLLSCPA